MNGNQSWRNLGEDIRNAVEDALQTGSFNNLNEVISDTVTSTIGNVKEQITRTSAEWKKGMEGWEDVEPDHTPGRDKGQAAGPAGGMGPGGRSRNMTEEWMEQRRRQDAERRGNLYGNQGSKTVNAGKRAIQVMMAPFKKIGRVSGTLYQVFGGIGTGIMAILSLVFLGLALVYGEGFWVTLGIFVLLLLAFIVMIRVGCGQKSTLRRAQKYWELSGHRKYINLEDLALHTNKPLKFILKDVKKMLTAGFFPEGHLDRQASCLMLDNHIYQEYLALEKQRKVQEQEKRQEEAWAAKAGKTQETGTSGTGDVVDTVGMAQADSTGNPELDAMIAQGRDCIRRLRDMNDNIPGEAISAKLFRLENLLKEIFESLREHPKQMPQMQKFMNYYLPTTIKLVGAYEEFDSLSVQGEEIAEAKAEIEKTLDTINKAFGELLNKLFRDTAYDVTTDAQVLHTMLAKEGLAGQSVFEFEKVPQK